MFPKLSQNYRREQLEQDLDRISMFYAFDQISTLHFFESLAESRNCFVFKSWFSAAVAFSWCAQGIRYFFVTQFLPGAGAVFGAHFVLEDVRRLRDGKALFCDLSHFADQDYTGMHHKVCSARCGSCKLFWETVSSLVSHLGFEALHRSFTVSQRLGVWTVWCRCKTV